MLHRRPPCSTKLQGDTAAGIAAAQDRKPPLKRHRAAIDLQIDTAIIGIVGDDELSAVDATIIPERRCRREKRCQAADQSGRRRADNNIPISAHTNVPADCSIEQSETALPTARMVISLPQTMA